MKTQLFLLASTAVVLAAEAPVPQADDISKNYAKTLTRLTEKPMWIRGQLSTDCKRSPDVKNSGPHTQHYVHYFRDTLAQKQGEKFAPGSVIVKEKLSVAREGEEPKIEAVAGMIKRTEGSHPKSGDWEFFWSEGGKVTTKGLESCAGCHSGAKRDYVFTDAPKKSAAKSK